MTFSPPENYLIYGLSMQQISNKYAFRTFRRRDWLQQYANVKSLQKFAKVFANFASLQKFLQTFANFWRIYFILFYFICEIGINRRARCPRKRPCGGRALA